MSIVDHTAVGQALGYVYQFERATYRLLEADSNVVSVAIEQVDDVSVHRADGTSIREQDKTTTGSGFSLSDRSVSLWKTLAIWADAVLAAPSVLPCTEFHLVTNGKVGPNSLATRLHAAKSASVMDSVAKELQAMAEGLREDLQPFARKVRTMPPLLLAGLVGKIFVFDNVPASFGGKLEDLQSLRLLSEIQRLAVFDHAASWVRRTVLTAASNGMPTSIDRAAFDRESRALLRHVAVAPLASVFDPSASNVDPANYRSHGFFQQLDWIDTDPDFVRDCVIHYALARAARVKWTDTGAVSEAALLAYQDDLRTRWKLQVRRESHRAYPSPIVQGQDRLTETLGQDSLLDGQPMPKAITCGNFHALADFDARTDPEIGWHPDFEQLVKTAKGDS